MRWHLAMICCIVICLILSLTYSHFPTDVSFPLSCINLEHTLLITRNPSYTGQSQSGILFLHQLLSLTQYLPPSSVGSPLFRRVQPLVAVTASSSWQLLSRSRSRSMVWQIYTTGAIFHPRTTSNPTNTKPKPDRNPDPFNTNSILNCNPNLNNPNQNHTPRMENRLEQIQLYVPRDGKYHLRNQTVILMICVTVCQLQTHYYYAPPRRY